jgi:hypothetical protein
MRDLWDYLWSACCHPWQYAGYFWHKHVLRSPFRRWARWTVDRKTQQEVMRNGWQPLNAVQFRQSLVDAGIDLTSHPKVWQGCPCGGDIEFHMHGCGNFGEGHRSVDWASWTDEQPADESLFHIITMKCSDCDKVYKRWLRYLDNPVKEPR